MAVPLSCRLAVYRSLLGRGGSSPRARTGHSTGGEDRRAQGGDCAAGFLSYISALLRDAPASVRMRHSHRAGVVGACGCADHHDLHSCHGQGCDGRDESVGQIGGRDLGCVLRLAIDPSSSFGYGSNSGMEDRTLIIRRLSTSSVFRIVAAGTFFFFIPLAVLFGVLALFGLNTIRWGNQPIYGISGLLLSPVIGLVLAGLLTAMGGFALACGLWLYSKFRPLRLRLIEDAPIAAHDE
jgi:hypothetical protein